MKINKKTKIIILITISLALLLGLFSIFFIEKIKDKVTYGSPLFELGRNIVYKARDVADLAYLGKMQGESDLPVYEISITKKSLDKMNEGLNSIGKDRVFEDELQFEVPAKFVFDDKEYDIKISYRGLQDIHWNAPKKSYSIKFDKDEKFDGVRKLNLILPIDRKYFVEHLNNYRAEKLGLMHVPTSFVNVKINNKLQGVYLQQEGWSDEFLKNVGKSVDGKLFKTRDIRADFCRDRADYYYCLQKYTSLWEQAAGAKDKGLNTYPELKRLFDIFAIKENDEFAKEIKNIADVEKFLKWNVHYLLTQSYHQGISNLRLYFNPENSKFEPVVWDVGMDMNHRHEDVPSNREQIDIRYNFLVDRLLEVPEFRHMRNELLWDYVKNDIELEDDMEFYDEVYDKISLDFYRDRLKRKSNFSFDEDVERFRTNIVNYYNNLHDILTSGSYIFEVDVLSSGTILLKVGLDGFTTLVLDRITLEFDDSMSAGKWSLLSDVNLDMKLDSLDESIGTIVSERSREITLEDMRAYMYVPYDYDKGVIRSTVQKNFFIVKDGAVGDIAIDDLDISVRHAHSGKTVDSLNN